MFSQYSPKFIIDAGANIGFAILFFKRHYPDATIVAVEPDSENCDMFIRNTRVCRDVHLVSAGLGSGSGGSFRIKNKQDEPDSYILEESKERSVAEVGVEEICSRFDGNRIDLIKIDIEGGEKELFARNTDWVARTDNILIETYDHIAVGCSKKLLEQTKGEFHLRVRRENLVLTREYLSIAN